MKILHHSNNRIRVNRSDVRGPESILYRSAWPLIYAIRAFGLAPYEFKDRELVPSHKYTIITAIWIIIFTSAFVVDRCHAIQSFYRNDMRMSTSVTEHAKPMLNYIIIMIDLISTLCTRKKITRIWNRIQNFDESLRHLGYARNEKSTWIWIWVVLLFNTVIWTIISTLGIIGFAEPWLKNVAYMILYIEAAASVTKFWAITMMLAQRFSQLNKVLQTTARFSPRMMTVNPLLDYMLIGCLHDDLMVTAESLNEIFFWSIILWLMNLSVHSTSSTFYALSWVLDKSFISPSIYFSPIYCLAFWITVFGVQIFMICHCCHQISYEANCMSSIMLEKRNWFYMYDRKVDPETSFHLVNRQLHFSAAGFFHVNLQLFTTIISVTTTYLCILLQF